jgi:hypothetical protein
MVLENYKTITQHDSLGSNENAEPQWDEEEEEKSSLHHILL